MKSVEQFGASLAATFVLFVTTGNCQPWSGTNGAVSAPQPFSQLVAPKPAPPQAPQPNPYGPIAGGLIALDAELREYTTKPGEVEGKFVFNLTNISAAEITLNGISTSCGCTVPQMAFPKKIAAGEMLPIPLTMNLAGKTGMIIKTATLMTDKGQKVLTVKSIITPPLTMGDDRAKNQMLAAADRQAVFKGDCARCHVEPAVGKVGKELYDAACGICHEAEHRAQMVTDLRTKLPGNAEYWRFSIVNGKPGTLMPAFAQSQTGPLSDAQIESLVQYMLKDYPLTKPKAPAPVGQGH
jgi:mono/diheme cytochrome c family protein